MAGRSRLTGNCLCALQCSPIWTVVVVCSCEFCSGRLILCYPDNLHRRVLQASDSSAFGSRRHCPRKSLSSAERPHRKSFICQLYATCTFSGCCTSSYSAYVGCLVERTLVLEPYPEPISCVYQHDSQAVAERAQAGAHRNFTSDNTPPATPSQQAPALESQ